MTCTVLFAKRAIRSEFLNAMHSVLPGDWILFSHISEKYKLFYLPEKMSTYRLHDSNSWANADNAFRISQFIDARWFVASRIDPAAKAAFQEELVGTLWQLGEVPGCINPLKKYRDTYEKLHNAHEELSHAHEELITEINGLMNSRSWKLTQPLRNLKKLLSKKN
jgi:hypothetical protein